MFDHTPPTVLVVTASARGEGSISRRLTDAVIDSLRSEHGDITLVTRDLRDPLPFVTETWMGGAFSDDDARTDDQRAALSVSDALIAEVQSADIIVIASPVYNFGPPAVLKAWIDQIARARVTFRYSDTGPIGMLDDRPVIVVTASGGTELGGEVDFLTGWLTHVLGFVGLRDVRHVAANKVMVHGDAAVDTARAAILDAVAASTAA